MANIDAPFGLIPTRHLNGTDWNGQTEKCYVHASYATALFIGDPVSLITETDHQDPAGKAMSVEQSTVGDNNPILGVVTSIDPIRTDLAKQYMPATTGGYVNVCIDPDVIFQIQDDGAAAPTKLFTGQNGVLIATHSGNTTSGISGMELDTNSDAPEANASNQLFIIKAVDTPNNILGTRTVWEVLISRHQLRPIAGILGVTAT